MDFGPRERLVLVFNKMFGRNGSAGGERGQFESSVFKTKYIQNHQKIIQWKPDCECSVNGASLKGLFFFFSLLDVPTLETIMGNTDKCNHRKV